MPHQAGRRLPSVGACSFSILSLYHLYSRIHLATLSRKISFQETHVRPTKGKTLLSPSLRYGLPLLGTPVLASVKEWQPRQPVRTWTMKPLCARPSGRWTLEKSLRSSCRRDGRKRLFPRLTLSPYRLYPNLKAQGRLRSYRSSSRYGSVPRANFARGGCEALRPHRALPSSATFSH